MKLYVSILSFSKENIKLIAEIVLWIQILIPFGKKLFFRKNCSVNEWLKVYIHVPKGCDNLQTLDLNNPNIK